MAACNAGPPGDRFAPLPDDLIENILSRLGEAQIRTRLLVVCKRFRRLAVSLMWTFESDDDGQRFMDYSLVNSMVMCKRLTLLISGPITNLKLVLLTAILATQATLEHFELIVKPPDSKLPGLTMACPILRSCKKLRSVSISVDMLKTRGEESLRCYLGDLDELPNLRSLILFGTTGSASALSNLSKRFPVLEEFQVMGIWPQGTYHLFSATLKSIKWFGFVPKGQKHSFVLACPALQALTFNNYDSSPSVDLRLEGRMRQLIKLHTDIARLPLFMDTAPNLEELDLLCRDQSVEINIGQIQQKFKHLKTLKLIKGILEEDKPGFSASLVGWN